ncbi:hypothetical protein GCM10022243_05780 [Saccharothrix violaceirubra]|uniref:Uncharacterized protein n=1 Tax=Saccharothrix violaceirubra TaxID=413306 RepID=A0A7W7WTZ9_9PSEU|nr:DUF5336 domain-containing protein [Saccharothrix violaceirubra]MBB4962988.1 hypothetical protein [Saccharothrix violaceirubra]
MSVPYGAPQQQPGPAQPAVGVNLNLILPLAGAGLGVFAYLLSFADDVSSAGIEYLLAAAALSGLSVLPKAPKLLYAAAVFALVPFLGLIQNLIKSEADVQGMQIVILIIALLQTAAIAIALLLDAEVVKFTPKQANVYNQPGGWNPQSGAFPQQQVQHPQHPQQQYGPPSGQFNQPVQPQQPQQPGQPQPTSYLSQPGQFAQPPQAGPQHGQGTPPGGFTQPS